MEAWMLFTKTSLLGALLLALFGVLAVWLERSLGFGYVPPTLPTCIT